MYPSNKNLVIRIKHNTKVKKVSGSSRKKYPHSEWKKILNFEVYYKTVCTHYKKVRSKNKKSAKIQNIKRKSSLSIKKTELIKQSIRKISIHVSNQTNINKQYFF